MIPQYNNIHPQSQYMQHPQYMQKMPMNSIFNDNMGASTQMFPGSNINQMPPNRLPQQQQQQQQQLNQQQLNQSHQQPMIDTKYSNYNPSNPFVGNTNYFYHGGNNSSNNNINKKN